MSKTISDVSKKLIEILFMDESIKRSLVDEKDNACYKLVTINDDGSITFGKTNIRWWNHLIGDEKTISFTDFALTVVKVLSGQKNNCKEIIVKGLGQEVIKTAIIKEEYDTVVDRLFDAARYGVKGPLTTKGFQISDDIRDHIEIKSRDGVKIVRLPGSGDPLCKVLVGITGVELA